MFGRRILFAPGGPNDQSGGGGLQSSQVSAPAPASDDIPAGPAKGSPERMPVSPGASQGPRDFTFNQGGNDDFLNTNQGGLPQTQVQSGPQSGGQQRQAPPTPTDPNLAPNTQTQAQAAAQWQSIRDAAGGLGYRFPGHVTDDSAALQYMIHQLQQRDYHTQLGQRLAPMAPQIQQMLGQNGGQFTGQLQQQNQPPARKAWEAPEFNKQWLNLVEQDPQTGMILAKQGVPYEIATKVQAYLDWKDKYDANPSAVMNDMVREAAREEASTLYQRQFQEQQTRQVAQSIVTQNSAWFYAKDAGGNPILDWQGNPQPSPNGLAYLRQLRNVQQAGITDPRQQDFYAKQAMQVEYYQAQARAAQQQQQNGGQVAQQFAGQVVNTNPHAALSPQSRAAQPGNVEPEFEDDLGALKAAMRQNIKAAGITDEDFQRQATFGG